MRLEESSNREAVQEKEETVRTLVKYETEHGNTEKIARAIAEALAEHGES